MLDEIREYEQYTMDVNKFESPDSDNVRLKYFPLIKKDFSGMARALTIIARHHIFPDGVMTDKFDEDRVQAVLRAWCGFNYKDKYESCADEAKKSKYEETIAYIEKNKLDNWLDRYIRAVFLAPALRQCGNPLNDVVEKSNEGEGNEKIENAFQLPLDVLMKQKSTLQSIEKDKSDKDRCKGANQALHTINALHKLHTGFRYMGTRMFAPEYKAIDTSAKGNDYKRITFENIIANAFSMGPLQRYYLVCGDKKFWDLIGKYTVGNADKAKKLSDSDKVLILKVAAACLLQAKYQQHGQEFVAINQMDIANWLNEKAAPEKFGLEKYQFKDSREPLFTSLTVGNNVKKLRIAPRWRGKDKGMFYIEPDDGEIQDGQEIGGRIFFSDAGAKIHLAKNQGKRYPART